MTGELNIAPIIM